MPKKCKAPPAPPKERTAQAPANAVRPDADLVNLSELAKLMRRAPLSERSRYPDAQLPMRRTHYPSS